MTTLLLAILCALITLIVFVHLLRTDQQRQHEEQLAAHLVTVIPPSLATSDPRVILGWANSFGVVRRLFPMAIQRIEHVSGGPFPVSNAIIEQVHARWTTDWLAWERNHNAEFQEKSAALEAEAGTTGRMVDPDIRARSARLEDEKLQTYQQRYEEYVSIGKALTDLRQSNVKDSPV